ncbi:HAD domain-containing protein [Arthrobacter ipis]|uniref:HAD domain-containing protein n=1 Tax=Arthrobacter ipis TaxID=2716202 RepID=UPI0028898536|nr:HAD domain-containing protein [Arthrobacter ipis]
MGIAEPNGDTGLKGDTGNKVTLYLDVDGVVCPFGPTGTTPWGSAWRYTFAGMLEVAYAAELVAALNRLSLQPGLRCVWLTSWEELAPAVLCPVTGLRGSTWPVLTSDGAGSGAEWWKLEAIQADVGRNTPERIIWVDDQLAFEGRAQAWARILGRRALLVSPDPRTGLSPRQLEAIRAFSRPPDRQV